MERGEIFMVQKLKQINDISIGDNVCKLRNAANLTQEQVVAQLQLRNLPTSRSVYSQIVLHPEVFIPRLRPELTISVSAN